MLEIQFNVYHILQGEVNRFSDRRISQKKLFGFRIWRIFYRDLRILLIQRIVDLSNIVARIVDLACNLVRMLDCDFIVELLADSNLDKTIVGSRILLQIGADRRICIPLFTPTPLYKYSSSKCKQSVCLHYGVYSPFKINLTQNYQESLHNVIDILVRSQLKQIIFTGS